MWLCTQIYVPPSGVIQGQTSRVKRLWLDWNIHSCEVTNRHWYQSWYHECLLYVVIVCTCFVETAVHCDTILQNYQRNTSWNNNCHLKCLFTKTFLWQIFALNCFKYYYYFKYYKATNMLCTYLLHTSVNHCQNNRFFLFLLFCQYSLNSAACTWLTCAEDHAYRPTDPGRQFWKRHWSARLPVTCLVSGLGSTNQLKL